MTGRLVNKITQAAARAWGVVAANIGLSRSPLSTLISVSAPANRSA